jgi:RNA polymerase sigma-B factor
MTVATSAPRSRTSLRSGVSDSPRTCASSAFLFRRLRRGGDRLTREILVRRFLPLAHRIARRYAHTSELPEDLMQVASLALVKAVDRFDPARGSSFQAFAVPTISGELKRHFRDTAWAVHVPRRAQERALAIERATDTLTNRLGHAPTVTQLAAQLAVTEDDVLDGLQARRSYEAMSLDAPIRADDEGDLTVAGTLGVEDERYELIEAGATLAGSADCLPELERRVMRMRFGGELTQSQIAARIGVSQMQVSRLLRRALQRIRERAGVAEAA